MAPETKTGTALERVLYSLSSIKRDTQTIKWKATRTTRSILGWRFYDFPDGNAQYERSKFAMLNMYHEWDGMQEIVAQERARAGKSNAIFEL